MQQNWDEVIVQMKNLNSSKQFDPTELASKSNKYAMSVIPYFSSLLESVCDEDDSSKINLLAAAYTSLDVQRVISIKDIFSDLSDLPEEVEMTTVISDLTLIFDDCESDVEIIDTLHQGFMRDVESDIERITSSSSLIRRVQKANARHEATQHLQDIAKIAAGTAIGILAASKLLGRRS